jgi:hypothetical protein
VWQVSYSHSRKQMMQKVSIKCFDTFCSRKFIQQFCSITKTTTKIRCGFYDGDCLYCGPLACATMQSCRQISMYLQNIRICLQDYMSQNQTDHNLKPENVVNSAESTIETVGNY